MKGFTLIEIIITLSLYFILVAIAVPITYDSYRAAVFRADVQSLVSLLQTARQEAIDNKNDSFHGVHLEKNTAILFRGKASNPDPALVENQVLFSGISFSASQDVVFSSVDGNALHNHSILLSDGQRAATITVTNLGRIDFSL